MAKISEIIIGKFILGGRAKMSELEESEMEENE